MKTYIRFLFAFILSLAVMFLQPECAAEETIDQDSAVGAGTMNIEYNAGTEYTIVIPAGVTFTDSEKTAERGIEARNVILPESSSLNVSISSKNNFRMMNGVSYIEYSLKINGNKTPDSDPYDIMILHAGEKSGWALLDFSTELDKSGVSYAGNYSDTLTFTISIS